MTIRTAVLAAILAGTIVPATANAETGDPANVIFIFDASGSMKRPSGDETRISAAKRVFGQTLRAMPKEGLQTGLIAFGHRRKSDCTDIELVSPLGLDMAQRQAEIVGGLEAIGETPIANAITQAGQALQAHKGSQNSIVLVTDGIRSAAATPAPLRPACRSSGST